MDRLTGLHGNCFENEPIARHTYYRIGGPARFMIEPIGLHDLRLVHRFVRENGLPFFFLGKGSNLLVSDAGFSGVVIKTQKLNLELLQVDTDRIRVGASVAVTRLLREASEKGWSGLTFLSGVPGSLGGVVVMNAGTHLGEVKDRVLEVTGYRFMDDAMTEFRIQPSSVSDFEYRKNRFLAPGDLVWSMDLRITQGNPETVKHEIKEVLDRRKATQPLNHPSCGSVFKNPRESGLHAWQVVDRLGLRGYRIGNASFSEVHANFIVNLGGATAHDVKGLIDLAKQRALAELGITLEEEVQYLGVID